MKLRVLVDNNTYIDKYYLGEPGASYYIEDGGTKFLFDVGYSDIFFKNADSMDIELEDISSIVLSHGHDDHTRGLKYYFDKKHNHKVSLYAHPNAFNIKISKGKNIGAPLTMDDLKDKCELILSKVPLHVSENIMFLGEIPRTNDFEVPYSLGQEIRDGEMYDDFLIDDSALVYTTDKGIYIITGCSHSGICNIIEYAKKVTNDERVLGIIGGLHLFKVDNRVYKTIEYFKENNIKELYPCHCTSFAVKAEIHKAIPINEVGTGLEITW